MEIPIYHKAIQKSAFAAGLDAVVYGMVKQTFTAPGIKAGRFMGSQVAHIARSVMSHKEPLDFLVDLIPEKQPGELKSYLEEGYAVAARMPRVEKGGAAANWDCAIVYAVAKAMNPDEIIETGTGVGATTCMALRATSDSSTPQTVTTFDREDETVDSDGIFYARWRELPRAGVGQLIPEHEENRTVFVLGDINHTLPRWINEERLSPRNPIKALVILDSMHTPEHQIFEAETLWPVLKEGSVILCDDTTYGWSSWAESYMNCGFLGGIRK